MNTRIAVITVIVLSFFATALFAQETANKSAGPLSSPCVVQLIDNSRLMVTILQKDVEVITKYGKQTVPFGDIRKIEFGFRCPPEAEKEIRACIENLKSSDFKERQVAQNRLSGKEIGHFAYPFVKKISEGKGDLESVRRATTAVEMIRMKTSENLLNLKDRDVLWAKEFMITGKVQGVAFKTRSLLGEITIDFHNICSVVRNVEHRGETIIIDAAQYGSSPDKWLNAKIWIGTSTRLNVSAEGQVDLWPQGPGQYMTGPKGYTTAGKGSSFMAGALIGRIGEKGKSFLIGGNYNDSPTEEGELFLQIVPSPWNNPSSGNYSVKIETDYALPR